MLERVLAADPISCMNEKQQNVIRGLTILGFCKGKISQRSILHDELVQTTVSLVFKAAS